MSRENYIVRLTKNYIRDPQSDCWNWTGSKTVGYGRIWVKDRLILAHRLSYQVFRGDIPKGIFVCHHCDNRACINPQHLFLGTPKENTQDCIKKGLFKSNELEKNGRAKLSRRDVIIILNSTEKGILLAKRFNVVSSTIYSIRKGRTWKAYNQKIRNLNS